MAVSPEQVAALLARLPEAEQTAWLRLLEIRVATPLLGNAEEATLTQLAGGRLLFSAPGWNPGRLDRSEIYDGDPHQTP